MSYILEALRKSETERKQGEIPSLGSSIQIIHKPARKGPSLLTWVLLLALLGNAAMLAWVFWPVQPQINAFVAPVGEMEPVPETGVAPPQLKPELASEPSGLASTLPDAPSQPIAINNQAEPLLIQPDVRPEPSQAGIAAENAVADSAEKEAAEKDSAETGIAAPISPSKAGINAPTLGTMPASFQRRVPNLTFNSHIYSSNPESRRIMINNEYLREGASFQGMTVEEITEDGVILNLQGESFVVSVVRNWNTPR